MFTGLVQAIGVVSRVHRLTGACPLLQLTVRAESWNHKPSLGDSVAVNGVCLTVARISEPSGLEFDIIPETLAKTTLGDATINDRVNLEHALTPSTFLGGHFVQGHVDGVGIVRQVNVAGDDWRLAIDPPHNVRTCLAPQGSITVNGVSLTIASLNDDGVFEVALIPTTLQLTTLGSLKSNSRVNIEADMIAKMIARTVAALGRKN